MFFVSIIILKNENWLKYFNLKANLDIILSKKYLHYSLMTIVTASTVPLAQLYVRSYVIKNISIIDAGYWESMNKLSAMYLMVIISSLSIYYLPRLSELKTKNELRKEIFKVYNFIIPLLIFGLISVFFLKKYIITILFNDTFMPMQELFAFQLIGDFFKIASFVLAFNLVAKAKTKVYIISEILGTISFLVLSFHFVNIEGVLGITRAYMINYVLYFSFLIYYFRDLIFIKNK